MNGAETSTRGLPLKACLKMGSLLCSAWHKHAVAVWGAGSAGRAAPRGTETRAVESSRAPSRWALRLSSYERTGRTSSKQAGHVTWSIPHWAVMHYHGR